MADKKMIIDGCENWVKNHCGENLVLEFSAVVELLEVLKGQETMSTGKTRIFQCEKCGYGIDDIYLSNEYDFDVYPHFCPNCGRSVKLE